MPSFNLQFADVVPRDHPIMAASGQNDCAMLKKIIENRTASPNCCTLEGLTPLHFAAASGHDGVCRLLLQEGASCSSTGFRGISPLHVAAHFGHVGVFKTLLGVGLDPNDYHENGSNAVFELLLSQRGIGLAEVSSRLNWLLHGQQQHFIDIQAKDSEHRGVISYVETLTGAPNDKSDRAFDKIKPSIEVLLDQGAQADELDIHRVSLLHQACDEGDLELVKMILQRKPDLEVRSQWDPGHDFGGWLDWTPLHIAVVNQHLMIASELVNSGADIDAGSESRFLGGRTLSPLKLAARNNDVEMLEMLFAKGAGKNDSVLIAALHAAIWTDAVEAVRFLIDDEGRRQIFTLKNIGARVPSTKMLEVLLEAGLLVVEEHVLNGNVCYWTHLTYAAWAADVSVVTSLLDHGANPNKTAPALLPGLEMTPLAFAALEGHLSIAALLLDRGADPSLTGKGSLPPAQVAIVSGYDDIASLILKHTHGAVPEARWGTTVEKRMEAESLTYDTQSPIELDLYSAID